MNLAKVTVVATTPSGDTRVFVTRVSCPTVTPASVSLHAWGALHRVH